MPAQMAEEIPAFDSTITDLNNSQSPVKPKVSVNAAKGKGAITCYFYYQYQDKDGQTKTKKVGGISVSWDNKSLRYNISGNCASYTAWLDGQFSIPGSLVYMGGMEPPDGLIIGKTTCSVAFGDKKYHEFNLSFSGKYKKKTDKLAGDLKSHSISGKLEK